MAWSSLIPLLLGLILIGQPTSQPVLHYVVLSPTESKKAAGCFPRWPNETVSGAWTLSQSDVDGLEANLSQVADIPFPNPAYRGSQIPHPEDYFRQYAGVLVDHRKIIFVNALCGRDGSAYQTDWRERFVLVYDGGNCYWTIRYDPETKGFSNLMVNGGAGGSFRPSTDHCVGAK